MLPCDCHRRDLGGSGGSAWGSSCAESEAAARLVVVFVNLPQPKKLDSVCCVE